MTQSRVLLEIKNKIAYVTLNRAEKHNGVDDRMMLELVHTAKLIRRDRSIRCVILNANGPSFCAGVDFTSMTKKPITMLRFFTKLPWRKDNMFQRVGHVWRDLPIPVIAAVHGNCLGAGVQIILACDYRIATADAKFSIFEINWGLIPDMSGMVTLSRLTRVDIAQELAMTGRFFSGIEAAEYGLISKISKDPLADAEALATNLCEKSPDAIAAAKYLFKKTWKKDTRKALFWERLTQLRVLSSKNLRIALKAGLAKDKKPVAYFDRSRFR